MYPVDTCTLLDALCPDWWQQPAMWLCPSPSQSHFWTSEQTHCAFQSVCAALWLMRAYLKLVTTKCLVLSALHREHCFECITGCNTLCIYCQNISNVYVPKQSLITEIISFFCNRRSFCPNPVLHINCSLLFLLYQSTLTFTTLFCSL